MPRPPSAGPLAVAVVVGVVVGGAVFARSHAPYLTDACGLVAAALTLVAYAVTRRGRAAEPSGRSAKTPPST